MSKAKEMLELAIKGRNVIDASLEMEYESILNLIYQTAFRGSTSMTYQYAISEKVEKRLILDGFSLKVFDRNKLTIILWNKN